MDLKELNTPLTLVYMVWDLASSCVGSGAYLGFMSLKDGFVRAVDARFALCVAYIF